MTNERRWVMIVLLAAALALYMCGCESTKGDCTIEPIPCVEEGAPVEITKLGGEQ
jgi:hypothetical protein